MLTLYRRRKSASSEDSDSERKIIPAGRPYLTKINGKLVMARGKRDRPAETAIDLLGEAFGIQTRLTHTRTKSLEVPKAPLMIAGTPYYSQQQPVYPSYTAPIPQLPFPPHIIQSPVLSQQILPPNIAQMAAYSQTQRYTIGHGKPTERDFEQLKDIDAHYKYINGKNKNQLSSSLVEDGSKHEDTTIKTTVTITKHVCANCGRLRSRKYHHKNPMKPGETSTPAFCGKCQKDATSTSDSDGSKSPKYNTKKEKVKGDRLQKKQKEKGGKESAGLGPSKDPLKPKKARKVSEQAPFEEYIVVEEDHSEEELKPRGRSRLRIEESDMERQLSPFERQCFPRRTRRPSKLEQHNTPARETLRERIVEEKFHEGSPSPYYQYVPAPVQAPPSQSKGKQDRREFSHYAEHNLYEPDYSPQISTNSQIVAPHRSMVSREGSFESASSSRSQESRRRRRAERSNPYNTTSRPRANPHVIHPRNGETVIVTERYVYRPGKQSHSEDGRRQQEYADKAAFDFRSRTAKSTSEVEAPSYYNETRSHPGRSTAEEEASRYYQDDWSRDEPIHIKEELPQRRIHVPGRYRRDASPDSSFAESESTGYVQNYAAPPQQFPQAPTPTPTSEQSSRATDRLDAPVYLLNSDEEAELPLRVARKGKAIQMTSPDRPSSQPGASVTSSHGPPLARAAMDGATNKALVLSPHRPKLQATSYDDSSDSSDMTELERVVQTQTRRVKFKNQDAVLPAWYSSASEPSARSVGKRRDCDGAGQVLD